MPDDTHIPGLYAIALPTPFAIGTVNAYLARGEVLTLIDCGVKTDDAYTALVEGLRALGHNISDIERLLITHHHIDHIGLAQRIVEESGAEIWCHPQTVPWIENPVEARKALQDYVVPIFYQGGVPKSVMDTIIAVDDYLLTLAGEVKADKTVEEGQSIELVGQQWEVYHTPGHAGDLICLYQPALKALLASDHLLKDVSSNPLIEAPHQPDEPRPRRLLDYMREMERIANLDIVTAYPGHGTPFHNIPELVEKRLGLHAKRAEMLYSLFDGQPRNLYELARLMFPKTHETQMYLMLSEVLGHIDILERDGRLDCEIRDDILYWIPHC
jgi:glyoxylase-like metal-dependent hydrolase (beta-lactamase superfamily II)